MADDLAAGHIEIAPRRTDHEKSSCTYCDYKGICKFDTTFPECKYVHIHKEKKEDAPQEADN
jgi:ATP-dependent helicase/nuclease subunit B